MDNWNFRGYIAVPLEEYGRNCIGSTCKTADEIECGAFVEAMLSVLSMEFDSLDDLKEFTDWCSNYADLPASKIPKNVAKEIFEEFKRLMKTK